jgi:hypothetical protein
LWSADAAEENLLHEGLLLASELTSNAIRHVGESFLVSLTLSADRFMVAVTDTSREEPELRPCQAGWRRPAAGCNLVDQLSRGWGVRLIHDTGKTVWASLDRQATST